MSLDLWREIDRPFSSLGSWRPLLKQLDEAFNENLINRDDNRALMPAIDVEEQKDYYLLHFDMPGINKENLNIDVQGRTLSVSGERKYERSSEGEGRRHFTERSYGVFSRTVSLPEGIRADQIEANYKDGVLTVAIPKAEEQKSRKIKIGEGKGGFLKGLFGSGDSSNSASGQRTGNDLGSAKGSGDRRSQDADSVQVHH